MDPKYEATLKHARDLEQFVQELQMQVNLKNAEISTLKNSQAFRYKEKKEPALPERAPDAHDITSMTPVTCILPFTFFMVFSFFIG
jgi:hypothetical protein